MTRHRRLFPYFFLTYCRLRGFYYSTVTFGLKSRYKNSILQLEMMLNIICFPIHIILGNNDLKQIRCQLLPPTLPQSLHLHNIQLLKAAPRISNSFRFHFCWNHQSLLVYWFIVLNVIRAKEYFFQPHLSLNSLDLTCVFDNIEMSSLEFDICIPMIKKKSNGRWFERPARNAFVHLLAPPLA